MLAEVSRAAGHKVLPGRQVLLETTKGKIVLAMFDQDSPKTTANFEKLVKKGFYDGTPFHRVIAGFVAQGGDPQGTGAGGPGYELPFEKNSLKHLAGSVAMARAQTLDSAGSQFFINLEPQPRLNQQYDVAGKPTGGYVVFGQVIAGWEVVRKLNKTMDQANNPLPGVQLDKILHAKLLD
ncbi:MAG: peptidylprolyl isomerase [Cyanobacteria bacterium NC_groundwater_1444_Ag_S-0.65um_54_12]|nr:peptidylprolyl isomerase [Cyanobacteria bacterium NC_groundwater_1444_Ag_S-0.65um_54_12]